MPERTGTPHTGPPAADLRPYQDADSGTVTVIIREHPSAGEEAFSGYQYHFRLQAGDSVAVTSRDPNSSASTRFFEVKAGGVTEERLAPHGEVPGPP